MGQDERICSKFGVVPGCQKKQHLAEKKVKLLTILKINIVLSLLVLIAAPALHSLLANITQAQLVQCFDPGLLYQVEVVLTVKPLYVTNKVGR